MLTNWFRRRATIPGPRRSIALVLAGLAIATAETTAHADEVDRSAATTAGPGSVVGSHEFFAAAGPYVPAIPGFDGFTAVFAALLDGVRLGAPDAVASVLTPAGTQVLARIDRRCQPDWPAAVEGVSIGAMLDRPVAGSPLADALTRYLRVPASGYHQPLFLAHGTADDTVPLALTQVLLTQFTIAGTKYEFHSYNADHEGIVDAAWPDVLSFLAGVLPPN